ncbi:MAG: hypothetical protein OEZ43_01520 [Gammaproteobacteria bacterium]|nr:hypothetical protein [Gammaproteobacteria bacterium]
MKVYLLLFLLLVVLRSADLVITYHITPDLAYEWNPLVAGLNLSWGGFLVVQSLLCILAAGVFYFYLNRQRCPVTQPGLGIRRFVFYYFNGFDANWRQWFASQFKTPNQRYKDAHLAMLGFVIPFSFVLVSVFAIAHNLTILAGIDAYHQFAIDQGYTYFGAVFISLILVSANIFFTLEFTHYRRNVSSERIPK